MSSYLAGHEPRIFHEQILRELAVRRCEPGCEFVGKLYASITEVEGAMLDFKKHLRSYHKGKFAREDLRSMLAGVAATVMSIELNCNLDDRHDK